MSTPALRFLHTADWQIGRQYQRFEADDAAALFEARFTVVERIAHRASQGQYDAVLVAGDVFDAQTVSERTIRRLFNAMQAYTGLWIMIPGNHDAALVESVWTRAQKLGVMPPNLLLALTPEPIVLHEQCTVILPAPLTQRQTGADLTAWFDHVDSPQGYVRIGLAHGSVTGILSEDVDASNPIAPDRAVRARLDYFALGDWHGMRQIDERTWYSGAPETDRFRNNESGHILDVTLEAAGAAPQVEAVSVGQYIWDAKGFNLSLPSDIDLVVQYLQTLSEHHVVSLVLTGRANLAGQARLNDALGAAQARVRALDYNIQGLSLHPTDDDIAALQADGYVAEVLHALRQMQGPDLAAPPGNVNQASPAQYSDATAQDQQRAITPDARVARDALALLAGILQRDTP